MHGIKAEHTTVYEFSEIENALYDFSGPAGPPFALLIRRFRHRNPYEPVYAIGRNKNGVVVVVVVVVVEFEFEFEFEFELIFRS